MDRCKASRNGAGSRRDSQFRAGQRVIGLHRMAADGLGNGVLAQPRQIHLAPRRLQFVHQIEREPARVGGLYERRQRVEQERALAKFTQPNAEPRERGQLSARVLNEEPQKTWLTASIELSKLRGGGMSSGFGFP